MRFRKLAIKKQIRIHRMILLEMASVYRRGPWLQSSDSEHKRHSWDGDHVPFSLDLVLALLRHLRRNIVHLKSMLSSLGIQRINA